jgi:hypothetical protein
LRENLDKLGISDDNVFATEVPCSAHLGRSFTDLLSEDSGNCDEAVPCSIVSGAAIVQNSTSVLDATSTSGRSCKHLGAHYKNLCIEVPEFSATPFSMSPVLGKVKRIGSESSTNVNVGGFQLKGRNESVEEQSVKLQNQVNTSDCDPPHVVPAAGEHNSMLSSTEIPRRCVSVLREPDSSEEGTQFSSLAQLADRHTKLMETKSSDGGSQFSSLSQLADRHTRIMETKSSDEGSQFSSLSQLADRHSPDCLRVAENQVTSNGKYRMGTETKWGTGQISCFQNGYVGPKTGFMCPSGTETMGSAEQEPVSPVVWRLTTCLPASDIGSIGTTSDSFSRMAVGPTPVASEEEIEMDLEIDLTHALILPGSKPSQIFANLEPEPTDWKLEDAEDEVRSDADALESSQLMMDFDLIATVLNQKLPSHKRRSHFGRTLCRKWKQLPTPYIPPPKQSLGTVVRFAFNTLSPDDQILRCLKPN